MIAGNECLTKIYVYVFKRMWKGFALLFFQETKIPEPRKDGRKS